MSDRVDALEIGGRQFSDIPIDRRDAAVRVPSKGAILIELRIDAHQFMTGRLQPVDEDAADVAAMPRYQYAHLLTPTFSRGLGPLSRVHRATSSPGVCPWTARTSYGDRPPAASPRRAVPWARAPNLSCRPGCTQRRPAPGQKTHH